jgi:hypothetical protein
VEYSDPLSNLAIPSQAVYFDAVQTPTITFGGGSEPEPPTTPEAPGTLVAVERNTKQRKSSMDVYRRQFGSGGVV